MLERIGKIMGETSNSAADSAVPLRHERRGPRAQLRPVGHADRARIDGVATPPARANGQRCGPRRRPLFETRIHRALAHFMFRAEAMPELGRTTLAGGSGDGARLHASIRRRR
jgi:hypothetical protein